MKRFLFGILVLLLSLHAAPAFALTSGTTTTGSITPGLPSYQSFSGSSGQGVILFASASYGVVIQIYDSGGTLVNGGTNRVSATLPSTGTYTVKLTGLHSTDGGGYSLDYVRGSAGTSNGSLTSGTSYNGTLATNGLESFTFSGTSGDWVHLFTSASFSEVITVYKPDGSYWVGYNDRWIDQLPSTGTYTVVIYGYAYSDNGSYRLDYVQSTAGVSNGSLTSGTSYNGTLATNGIESFQFTGTSGQGVNLYVNASYTAVIRIYRPDGSYWWGGNNRYTGSLDATGTFTVVVYGYYTTDNGSYRLDFVRAGATAGVPNGVSNGNLYSGYSFDGTLATNGLESFHFNGTSGQGIRLYVDSYNTPSYLSLIHI